MPAARIRRLRLNNFRTYRTAQIDVSGRWHFTFSDDTFGLVTDRILRLTQTGSTVTVSAPSPYTVGTIDPLSGALHLDGSGSCRVFPTLELVIIPWSIDATASADGLTITGSFAGRLPQSS